MSKILIGASVLPAVALRRFWRLRICSKVKGLRYGNGKRDEGVANSRSEPVPQNKRISKAVKQPWRRRRPNPLIPRHELRGRKAELIKVADRKSDLQSKLQARESEIAELRKRVERGGPELRVNRPAPSTAELQANWRDSKAAESAENGKEISRSETSAAGQERPQPLLK